MTLRAALRIPAVIALAAALSSCFSLQAVQQEAEARNAALKAAADANAAQLELADSLFNDGEYQQALDAYGQLLASNHAEDYAYGQRGECLRMLGRHDEALVEFDRSLQLQPDNYLVLARRGETYRAKGEYAKAIADLDRSLQIEPDWHWSLGSRGDAYRLLERFPEAIADFSQALALSPEYPWAQARRGEAYRMTQEHDKALADLDAAIRQAPEDSFAYASRGQVYKETGRYEQALADFQKAIQLDPNYAWAKDRLAELQAAMAEGKKPAAAPPSPAATTAPVRTAGPLPLVTVLDFTIENIPKSEGGLIVDLVFSALVSAKRYRVLDRGQRDNILKEIEFSYSQCADEKCQLEIGRLLAADRIVVGSLGKVGQRYILNAKMLDVQTGEALSTAYRIFSSLEALVDGTEQVALSLAEG